MDFLLRNRLFTIWLFLSGLTVLTWWLGSKDTAQTAAFITYGVLLIAFVKTRLVIRNFMEVREAPLWLRLLCDGWLVLLFAILALFYRYGL
jgi:Prokaryotic Cytochrome C oxidase subunit IV